MDTFKQRHSFSSTKSIDYPDFLDIQIKSFHDFFQIDTDAERRHQEGLFKVFSENFPIVDARNSFVLEFLDYTIDGPRYTIDECLESCGEFLDTIFVGDGVKVHREYIKEKLGDKAIFPPANALNSRASSVAALALDKAKRGETQSYLEMKPYYIRKSQAERELEERENKEKGESK